jgi:hypothetical protein
MSTSPISLFVECGNDDELEWLFTALSADGDVAMPLDDYGFSHRTDGSRTASACRGSSTCGDPRDGRGRRPSR